MNFVFENEYFVVLEKPAMVLTTPSREGAADERQCLGWQLQSQLKRQIYPIHRLDFEVSGLVMFAKEAKAHAQANEWFEHKKVFKTYQALTQRQSFAHIPDSVPNPREKIVLAPSARFHWACRLLRGKRRAYEHATGKDCETDAVYLDDENNSLKWELHPLTGRPHQLRFELSRHGFPILGDKLYGSEQSFSRPGIALRAVKIDFRQACQAADLGLPEVLEIPGIW